LIKILRNENEELKNLRERPQDKENRSNTPFEEDESCAAPLVVPISFNFSKIFSI